MQCGERLAQRSMVGLISLAPRFHQESSLDVAILHQQNWRIGVSLAKQFHARHSALRDELRAHIREAIQHKDRGIELGHKLHHLRFHAPIAGEA